MTKRGGVPPDVNYGQHTATTQRLRLNGCYQEGRTYVKQASVAFRIAINLPNVWENLAYICSC